MGIQIETKYKLGFHEVEFMEIDRIQNMVIVECLTRYQVKFCLSVILKNEETTKIIFRVKKKRI